MTAPGWVQLAVLLVSIVVGTRLLGPYLAGVFSEGPGPGGRFFEPIERVVYRLLGVDPRREQRWNVYALSVLAFSLCSVLVVYVVQRLQEWLPLNPSGVSNVPAPLAFNTAVSFTTNTNWQNYSGESTMSHLTQMAALTVQNFASAAVGLAVAVALIRGLVRRKRSTIGSFWVDITRGVVRVLLPMATVAALVFAANGVVQNLSGGTSATTVEGASQWIPGGPMASQEAIKELGTNGGGFVNANSAHPFENPNGFTNLFEIFLLLLIPFALTYAYGRMVKDQRQGWVVFAAMVVLWAATAALAVTMEVHGNPELTARAIDQTVTAESPGGNAEGKEVRFGPAASGLYAASTTGTSTGAVDSMHDSYTPLGGMAPLVNMMLGEVSPGGVGAGLYGMLVFVLTAVFIAGLMVGRTPEYLGKKIQANEIKLVVVYILAVPLVVLGFTGVSMVLSGPLSSLLNTGPHGLTEMTYAFTSAGNNNGSAFAGLTGNTDWFNTTLGLAMLVGRFVLIIPVLAIAGSLVRKQTVPPSAGTFPTGTPLFTVLLVGVVVIVVGLTYFPVLALGPIVEHLSL
ncbi:MAG: potassium-transporting ATPase subunit KdpA [Acidimicrobiales bacterium]